MISGGLASNDLGFLQWVYKGIDQLGLDASPFDQLGAHPFAGDHAPDAIDPAKRYERNPFGLYDENFTGFSGLHEVMDQNGDGDKPIYITQFGYSTRAGGDRNAVPDDLRAQYLTQAFKQATCSSYVSTFSWYALHPTPWDGQEYTLLDKQNRPNQTYAALAAWGQRVAEATAGSVIPEISANRPRTAHRAARLVPTRPLTPVRTASRCQEVPGASASIPDRVGGGRALRLPLRPRVASARALPARARLRAVHVPEVPGGRRRGEARGASERTA